MIKLATKNKVGLLQSITHKKIDNVLPIEKVFEIISGNCTEEYYCNIKEDTHNKIDRIRNGEDKDGSIKTSLIAITGIHISDEGISEKNIKNKHLNGLVWLDIDIDKGTTIDDFTLNIIKSEIMNIDYVLSVFESANRGLRVVIKANYNTIDEYQKVFPQVCDDIEQNCDTLIDVTNINIDRKCDDITRRFFLSKDYNLYYNPDAEVFEGDYTKKVVASTTTKINTTIEHKDAYILSLENEVKQHKPKHKPVNGERFYYIRDLIYWSLERGVTKDELKEYILKYYGDKDEEIQARIKDIESIYNKNQHKFGIKLDTNPTTNRRIYKFNKHNILKSFSFQVMKNMNYNDLEAIFYSEVLPYFVSKDFDEDYCYNKAKNECIDKGIEFNKDEMNKLFESYRSWRGVFYTKFQEAPEGDIVEQNVNINLDQLIILYLKDNYEVRKSNEKGLEILVNDEWVEFGSNIEHKLKNKVWELFGQKKHELIDNTLESISYEVNYCKIVLEEAYNKYYRNFDLTKDELEDEFVELMKDDKLPDNPIGYYLQLFIDMNRIDLNYLSKIELYIMFTTYCLYCVGQMMNERTNEQILDLISNKQGTGKTKFVEGMLWLFVEKGLVGDVSWGVERDDKRLLFSKGFLKDEEGTSRSKAEVGIIKRFTSESKVVFTDKNQRKVESWDRRANFVLTSNEVQFLKEESRRDWIIKFNEHTNNNEGNTIKKSEWKRLIENELQNIERSEKFWGYVTYLYNNYFDNFENMNDDILDKIEERQKENIDTNTEEVFIGEFITQGNSRKVRYNSLLVSTKYDISRLSTEDTYIIQLKELNELLRIIYPSSKFSNSKELKVQMIKAGYEYKNHILEDGTQRKGFAIKMNNIDKS